MWLQVVLGYAVIYFKGACFDQLLHPFPELLKSCTGLYTYVKFAVWLYVQSLNCFGSLISCEITMGNQVTWRVLGYATPIECSAIGLLTLCLTETHTELRTQRVDLLENNIHYIQNSTSPISFKFRSQIKIPSLVPFVPVGV